MRCLSISCEDFPCWIAAGHARGCFDEIPQSGLLCEPCLRLHWWRSGILRAASETSMPRLLARSILKVSASRNRCWSRSKLVSFKDGTWRHRPESFSEGKDSTEDIFFSNNWGKWPGSVGYLDRCCQSEMSTEFIKRTANRNNSWAYFNDTEWVRFLLQILQRSQRASGRIQSSRVVN